MTTTPSPPTCAPTCGAYHPLDMSSAIDGERRYSTDACRRAGRCINPSPATPPPTCATCGGMGVTQFDYADSTPSLVAPCWVCHGSGVEMARTDDGIEGIDCTACDGTGRANPATPKARRGR